MSWRDSLEPPGEKLRELPGGSSHINDDKTANFPEEAKKIVEGKGVDLVVDLHP